MQNVRRWYIYLTSAIGLHVVAWAVISLLRNLLDTSSLRSDATFLALQIAIIIIGLPVFLIHWLWAQRLAAQEQEEKEAILRRVYFYGNLAGFLGPILANAYALFVSLLDGEPARDLLGFMVAIVVLALLFVYHRRLLDGDIAAVPEEGFYGLIRRCFVFAFSTAGLWITIAAVINILRWLFLDAGGKAIYGRGDALNGYMVALGIGLLVWVYFWRWAESLFNSAQESELASALRKFYLYAAVFVTALGSVGSASAVLAALLRRWMGLPPQGESGQALAVIITLGVFWAYHAFVLRRDAAAAPDAPRQAAVRRLYLYLVAWVGLGAFLIGLVGDLNVLISALTEPAGFGMALKSSLAGFTAALVAGLPVWLLPWRAIQLAASGPDALDHRRSLVRKIYLYFYLFVATMTVLVSLIAVVYQLLLFALGERSASLLLPDLAQPFSFALIAVAVLLYHGSLLREDNRRERAGRAQRLEAYKLIVLAGVDGGLGPSLVAALRAQFPSLDLLPIGLDPEAAAAMDGQPAPDDIPALLAAADLILAPWEAVAVGGGVKLGKAVLSSPARKLLLPVSREGLDWVSVEPQRADELVVAAVKAVSQVLADQAVKPARSMSAGAIVLIVVGALLALTLLPSLIGLLFGF